MPEASAAGYQIAYRRAVARLAGLDLGQVARRSGSLLEGRRLTLSFLGANVEVELPAGGDALLRPAGLTLAEKILLLHYLVSEGARETRGELVSFKKLPGASFYEPTYRKRGAARIARRFGEDVPGFERACRALGWTEEKLGDAAFGGPVLPALRCVAVLHRGDEEFPAEANLLFDERIGQFLPLEDVAVLAGLVATRLTRAG